MTEPAQEAKGLRAAWLRLMSLRLGVVPAPLAAAAAALGAAFVALGKVPADLPTQIAVLAAGGFLCAEIGARTPLLNRLGLAAILATFLPSWLVHAGLLPPALVRSIADFTDQSNVLYLFIATVVVGSILGMDRRVLTAGFAKIFVPLAAGSVAAFAVGCSVGVALGLGFRHTLFKIVAPIMAGGVGEGAIPLSIGYAQLGGGRQGDLFAEVLPAVMLGSLCAILLAGLLNGVGKRWPALTGDGALQRGAAGEGAPEPAGPAAPSSPQQLGAALVLVAVLFLAGALAQRLWGWPGPVVMLALAVAVKLGGLAPPDLEQAAHANYRFFRACVTYPLLFAIGVAKTPWDKLAAAFNGPTLVTIAATVAMLTAVGFGVGRLVGLYPVEAALVNATHSGQGGTGDVAILTAAERLALMPFAQIATRIGGAITVTLVLVLFAKLGAAP